MTKCRISLSVVSHGQNALVRTFLTDLAKLPSAPSIEVLVTENVAGQSEWLPHEVDPASYRLIRNRTPLGFGANHNQAFRLASSTEFFCIANPDIRLPEDPFPPLLETASRWGDVITTPLVLGRTGQPEDHVRRYPTPINLLLRRLGGPDGATRFERHQPEAKVDWAAGMFLLIPSGFFRRLGGFDERFFMYCEDIDLSLRAWKTGGQVMVNPAATVVHDARRASGKAWRPTVWHINSLLRYFAKHGIRPLRHPAQRRDESAEQGAPRRNR